ncbi:MAG: putative diguanylate cyclase YegE [Syntrophaceae bacterium PtaU1.Bin231]|nr:MAG: putative diguanylate cyclase YegE [Syntrophaceae bacterium PtaU1.Bin231]
MPQRKKDERRRAGSKAQSGRVSSAAEPRGAMNRLMLELKQAEEKYRNIIENIGVGVAMIDPQMRILTLNRQMREWFPDVDPAVKPLCYKSFNDPPARDVCPYCPTIRTLRDGQVHEAVTDTPMKGGVRNFRIIATPVTDAGGRVVAAIEMVEDITERQRAAKALRASEQRHRSYIELTGQLGWTANAAGEVVEDLPAWRAFTGQGEEEIKGAGWANALHPDDRERALEAWRKALATKSAYELECRVRRRDGVYRHWLARAVPLLDEDGGIREWLGTLTDITDMKRVEEELKKSEDMYRTIFETTPAATMIVEEDTTISMVNREFAVQTGYDAKEIEGKKSWTEFILKEDLGRLMAYYRLRQLDPEAAPRNYEFRYTDSKGRIRDVYATVSRMPGTKKTVLSLLDITDRKRNEESLRTIAEELKSKTHAVEEMNAALRVLLKQREEDKIDLEKRILASMKELVIPHLRELKKCLTGQKELTRLQILESNLQGIMSPFAQKLSLQFLNLTQKEIQVANLIKEGKTTKEIARFMDLSKFAIDTHRARLRSKLGLTRKKANLRTYLSSIME